MMLANEERSMVAEIMRDCTKFAASSCVVAEALGLECEMFDHCGECEKALAYHLADLIKPINGETSDGYHTFNELYHHRALLFSVIVRNYPELSWKSKKHSKGDMYKGMFIVGINTPDGQASYHYDIEPYWDMFECEELEFAPEWDGHTSDQAIERIGKLMPRTCRVDRRVPSNPFCLNCGKDWEDDWCYCPRCGAEVME